MPEETAQNGLSESAASGLAYLTFIPAIIFLVVAPYNTNPTVKFHSWQSIFLGCIWVALSILGMFLVIIPILGILLDLLLFGTLFVLWIICLIKAFGGSRFVIPVIGPLAAKQAGIIL